MLYQAWDCLSDMPISGEVDLIEAEKIRSTTKGKDYCYLVLPVIEQALYKAPIFKAKEILQTVKVGELF